MSCSNGSAHHDCAAQTSLVTTKRIVQISPTRRSVTLHTFEHDAAGACMPSKPAGAALGSPTLMGSPFLSLCISRLARSSSPRVTMPRLSMSGSRTLSKVYLILLRAAASEAAEAVVCGWPESEAQGAPGEPPGAAAADTTLPSSDPPTRTATYFRTDELACSKRCAQVVL